MKSPGFWIKEDILSYDECSRITEVLRQNEVKRSRAGARNLMAVPKIKALAEDRRLLEIGEEVTGLRLVPYKATLFEKTGKANWLVAFHQDTALPLEEATTLEGWGPSAQKEGITFTHAPTWALEKILAVRIHLDASTSLNGPLRVVPNSHHKKVWSDDEFAACVSRQGEI